MPPYRNSQCRQHSHQEKSVRVHKEGAGSGERWTLARMRVGRTPCPGFTRA